MDRRRLSAYHHYTRGGGGYSPTDFEGLKFWYDISQLTGLNDGDQIPTLVDYSGNGKNITQVTGSRRGIYKVGIQNGKPALLNNAQLTAYVGTKTDWDWVHQGNSTLFFVWSISVDNAVSTLFDNTGGTSTTFTGRNIYTQTTALLKDECYAGSSGNYVFKGGTLNNQFPKNVICLTVHRFEQGKDTDDFTIDKNGVLLTSIEGTVSPSASTSTASPTWFNRANLTNGFQGYFLESFGYDRALTATEITNLLGRLIDNFGL